MIPWANFDTGLRNEPTDEFQIPLHERWLTWIEVGPSMKELFLESPMLEVAHERQFAISQQGGYSANFISEHTSRMEDCLIQLSSHFRSFAIDQQCQPSSPFGTDLIHCWRPELQLGSIPPLSLNQNHPPNLISNQAQQPSNLPPMPVPKPPVLATMMAPEPDLEAEEMSDDTAETFTHLLKSFPRARTSLPIHSARANRNVRQRKQFESKLSTEPATIGQKRKSQWMANRHEDDIEATIRRQSLSSYRANFEANPMVGAAKDPSHIEPT